MQMGIVAVVIAAALTYTVTLAGGADRDAEKARVAKVIETCCNGNE